MVFFFYLSESIKSGTNCKLVSSIRFVYCVSSNPEAFDLMASKEAAKSPSELGNCCEPISAPGCRVNNVSNGSYKTSNQYYSTRYTKKETYCL